MSIDITRNVLDASARSVAVLNRRIEELVLIIINIINKNILLYYIYYIYIKDTLFQCSSIQLLLFT